MERKTQKCLLVAWIEQKKGLEQHGVVRWVLAGDFEGWNIILKQIIQFKNEGGNQSLF